MNLNTSMYYMSEVLILMSVFLLGVAFTIQCLDVAAGCLLVLYLLLIYQKTVYKIKVTPTSKSSQKSREKQHQ